MDLIFARLKNSKKHGFNFLDTPKTYFILSQLKETQKVWV